ncbi:hypothetical protein BCR42DRAFT_84470 [Absidia repens]|uniref:Uncharacterized protein n=1 Tax=Absidia repens TaxID=90262 RepID=A0A1X2IXM9_9FUNG|nr:hypothetical protein BCR42DRAFT_84470 [Absidia repens]
MGSEVIYNHGSGPDSLATVYDSPSNIIIEDQDGGNRTATSYPVEHDAEANQKEKEGQSHQDPSDIENNDASSVSLPPLDGARGWLVILGAFFIQVLCFGTASSWGEFSF